MYARKLWISQIARTHTHRHTGAVDAHTHLDKHTPPHTQAHTVHVKRQGEKAQGKTHRGHQ